MAFLRALTEHWYLGVILAIAGAFGRSRDLALSAPVMLIGVAWVASVGSFFVFLVSTCAICNA